MKKEGLAGIYSKKGDELSEGRIGVKLFGSSGEVFYEIALEMLSIIEENNRKKEERVFIVPVGPVGQYPIFTCLVNERRAEEFALRSTRVLAISGETRTVNAIADLNGALDEFPLYAVTVGMKEILLARKIRLSLFRPWHRSVLRRALFSEPTGAFPVTLIQSHKAMSAMRPQRKRFSL